MANLSDILGGGGSGFEVVDEQIFTASGTWTPPADFADTDYVQVFMWGGGGGGGATNTTSTVYGGAGGSFLELLFPGWMVEGSQAVGVGAGGNGASTWSSSQTQTGGTGGYSYFGDTNFTATGGKGGSAVQVDSSSVQSMPGPLGDIMGAGTGAAKEMPFLKAYDFYLYQSSTAYGNNRPIWRGGNGGRDGGGAGTAPAAAALGSSVCGGSGGTSSDGQAPGGGGAANKGGTTTVAWNGARGEVRVRVLRGVFAS